VGTGTGLDVLGEGFLFCFSQDLNPISSIVYPSHCTDCASPCLKIIQMSVVIKWDARFGLDVLDHDINFWKVPLNIVISIEVL
jgi:hypothetical protein